jgi:hypothetical protein
MVLTLTIPSDRILRMLTGWTPRGLPPPHLLRTPYASLRYATGFASSGVAPPGRAPLSPGYAGTPSGKPAIRGRVTFGLSYRSNRVKSSQVALESIAAGVLSSSDGLSLWR